MIADIRKLMQKLLCCSQIKAILRSFSGLSPGGQVGLVSKKLDLSGGFSQAVKSWVCGHQGSLLGSLFRLNDAAEADELDVMGRGLNLGLGSWPARGSGHRWAAP